MELQRGYCQLCTTNTKVVIPPQASSITNEIKKFLSDQINIKEFAPINSALRVCPLCLQNILTIKALSQQFQGYISPDSDCCCLCEEKKYLVFIKDHVYLEYLFDGTKYEGTVEDCLMCLDCLKCLQLLRDVKANLIKKYPQLARLSKKDNSPNKTPTSSKSKRINKKSRFLPHIKPLSKSKYNLIRYKRDSSLLNQISYVKLDNVDLLQLKRTYKPDNDDHRSRRKSKTPRKDYKRMLSPGSESTPPSPQNFFKIRIKLPQKPQEKFKVATSPRRSARKDSPSPLPKRSNKKASLSPPSRRSYRKASPSPPPKRSSGKASLSPLPRKSTSKASPSPMPKRSARKPSPSPPPVKQLSRGRPRKSSPSSLTPTKELSRGRPKKSSPSPPPVKQLSRGRPRKSSPSPPPAKQLSRGRPKNPSPSPSPLPTQQSKGRGRPKRFSPSPSPSPVPKQASQGKPRKSVEGEKELKPRPGKVASRASKKDDKKLVVNVARISTDEEQKLDEDQDDDIVLFWDKDPLAMSDDDDDSKFKTPTKASRKEMPDTNSAKKRKSVTFAEEKNIEYGAQNNLKSSKASKDGHESDEEENRIGYLEHVVNNVDDVFNSLKSGKAVKEISKASSTVIFNLDSDDENESRKRKRSSCSPCFEIPTFENSEKHAAKKSKTDDAATSDQPKTNEEDKENQDNEEELSNENPTDDGDKEEIKNPVESTTNNTDFDTISEGDFEETTEGAASKEGDANDNGDTENGKENDSGEIEPENGEDNADDLGEDFQTVDSCGNDKNDELENADQVENIENGKYSVIKVNGNPEQMTGSDQAA